MNLQVERDRIKAFFNNYYEEIGDYSVKRRDTFELNQAINYFLHRKMMERIILTILNNQGISLLHDKRILDVGCGDGSRFRPFLEWGARPGNIYALDVNETVLARAREYSPAGVNFICGYGDQIPLESDGVDILLNFGVIIHVMDNDLIIKMVEEFRRVLKPSGLLFLFFSNQSELVNNNKYICHGTRTFSSATVKGMFKDFKLIKEYNCFLDNPLSFGVDGKPVFPDHVGYMEDFLLTKNPMLTDTLFVLTKE
ncbi:MAG: class I SAM-dependent methyltransferase [Firmicutes bacterium]|nr:class I SAM-dependent methyltransferase [Bacillota bacterium]